MKACLLLLCVFCSAVAFAQSGAKISGKVSDTRSHQPVEFATVTVTDKASNKIINGALTDSTGSFVVTDVPAGLYIVGVESIGYSKKTIDSVVVATGKNKVSLGIISLQASGKVLKDVTITSSAPIIENKIDKMVYNAANDITSQGGLALDVLKKVPQVNVDIDGNVELQGNPNIRFLINGKPSSVFGNSITDALSAIPASQIKSIEVITSPGAKYDAQGTGGIINIILKDNKMQGINGSINLSGGTLLENGSASLNFRHNTWGINTYVSGNAKLNARTPQTQDRSSYDSALGVTNHLVQDGYSDFRRNGYQAGMGFDWSITKKDNVTAAFSLNHFANTGQGLTTVQQDTAGAALPINSVRNSYNHFQTTSFDWSLNYKKNFKREGQELDVLYSASYGEPNTQYQQYSTYSGAATPYTGSTSYNPGTDQETNISIDYTQPVKEHVTIETGVKTVLQSIHSTASVADLQTATQEYVPDAGQSYDLQYDMHIYAAYLSASFPLTTFLKVKAGARYEYTETTIDFPNTSIPSYGTLVPSVILSHDFKEGEFIKLAYTRRIERADYGNVNPFLNFSDPYNITTGNPTLKPEFGNAIELGYNKTFKKSGNIYIALIQRINTGDHKQVTTFYPAYKVNDTTYSNVSVTNTQNIGVEYNSGINVSGSYTIKDKLTLRANVFLMRRHSVGLPPGSNTPDGYRFRTNLNATYQLPHNLVIEAFGNYNSASNNIQGKTPQWVYYTFAFRKQFWNKNASIGATATNLFNAYTRQVTTVETSDYTSYMVRSVPYRSVGISLTYKFGKLEFKKGKEDDMNSQPGMGN